MTNLIENTDQLHADIEQLKNEVEKYKSALVGKNEYQKIYYNQHKKDIINQIKTLRGKSEESKEKYKVYQHEYIQDKKEKLKLYQQNYILKNKEILKEKSRLKYKNKKNNLIV